MGQEQPTAEPIPGYVLKERLGAGGYGEVWKAEVPGGLQKAVKIVYGHYDDERATNELKSLNRIKLLRHPFLLSLERIEVIAGRLTIVTELADGSLKDLFKRCRDNGASGINREELLQFMRDAAEALDYMNERHSLQHLDVKPENLLLVGSHVKVADFGLVKDIQEANVSVMNGLTPLYAAPELFSGLPSRRSDQYSLAIVYLEMLTGSLPFPGKTTAQIASQHLHATPDLQSLLPGDRAVIARALAKDPNQRFAHCREMIDHLSNASLQQALPPPETWFQDKRAAAVDPAENPVITQIVGKQSFERADDALRKRPAQPSEEKTPAAPVRVEETTKTQNDFNFLEDADEPAPDNGTKSVATFLMETRRDPELTQRPMPPRSGISSLRPTLIIGVGGIAATVLQKLKLYWQERLQGAPCPAVETLLLDTDSQDLQKACRGDEGASLQSTETLHLPLRKSSDYRGESPDLLRWISRRWLFNIPRSQKTEGLRPLGRLALVDNARTVHSRIHKALQRIVTASAGEASQTATGCPFNGSPRVIVVGSIAGGTGGGMMLDVGLIARQLLQRRGCQDRDVTGIMLYHRGRNPSTHDLAAVNAFATLSEFQHYAGSGRAYPGDRACGIEPRDTETSPFRQAYFRSLGDRISDAELNREAEQIAEYLYLDTCTPVSLPIRDCRGQDASLSESHQLTLRSFSVNRVGVLSSDLIPWGAATLCSELIQRWIGEAQTDSNEVEAAAEQQMKQKLSDAGWSLEALQRLFLEKIQQKLPAGLDTFYATLLDGSAPPLNAAQLAKLEFKTIWQRVNQFLGVRADDFRDTANWPDLLKAVAVECDSHAQSIFAQLSVELQRNLDTPGLRISTAQRAWKSLIAQLNSLREEATALQRQWETNCQALEGMLGLAGGQLTPPQAALRKQPKEFRVQFYKLLDMWQVNLALHYVQALARRLSALCAKPAEQLLDMRRDLRHLREQVQPSQLTSANSNTVQQELRTWLERNFQIDKGTLVARLDEEIQRHIFTKRGGFQVVITPGGDARIEFVASLFHAARRTILESLENFEVTEYLLRDGPNGETIPPRLASSLEQAKFMPAANADFRGMISCSQSVKRELLPKLSDFAEFVLGAYPSVVTSRDRDLIVLLEASQMSLTNTALRLIDDRGDLKDYATRIFARNDIPFEPITATTDSTSSSASAVHQHEFAGIR